MIKNRIKNRIDNAKRKLQESISSFVAKSMEQKSCVVFLLLLVGLFVSSPLFLDPTILLQGEKQTLMAKTSANPNISLNATVFSHSKTCLKNYSTIFNNDPDKGQPPPICPEYFRWLHEDLRPWTSTGITRDMIERARPKAHIRLVIVDGKVYVEKLAYIFQTRDIYTVWGVLQLLRRYPGKIPDLELMFDCGDHPMIRSTDYSKKAPPVLFSYCGDDRTLAVVFPDWSFWGWPEVNVKPWEILSKELKEGNKISKWTERQPFAYWKGNPQVAAGRQDLMKCNVSRWHDWGARLYAQNWLKETKKGFKESDLKRQCIHRYKIYIEGQGWSVSEKYILACDSLTLLIKPRFYDFFTRGLMPLQHYWPIKADDKCRSIRHAVDWGNTHIQEAQEIGKKASKFVEQELHMDFVYDYMFHLLNKYAKLLRFKPVVPPGAVEVSSETVACPRSGVERQFMEDSLVKRPANTNPCILPPPFEPATLETILQKKYKTLSEVESLEKQTRHD